jgi:hypothetical protein
MVGLDCFMLLLPTMQAAAAATQKQQQQFDVASAAHRHLSAGDQLIESAVSICIVTSTAYAVICCVSEVPVAV